MNRAELKSTAKEQLRGRWGLAIITVLVSNLIINSYNMFKGVDFVIEISENLTLTLNLISLIFGGVVSTGLSKFLLNFTTNREVPKFADLFSQFKIFFKALGLFILMGIAIILGTLFFIIPGIIVALMFSQAFYILAENPNKGIFECLEESSNLMHGYKWELFVLQLSFIGWELLAVLTFGIASLWINPYQKVTEANFYLKLKYNI
ncbi:MULTISPECIES: DUF975 family protein [Clostridium]|jgi:uncharacterized membrane protein|uniref:DUF975 family protein n=1 Tax=Clostridium TaxID=1485 RepID=UPI0018ABD385|nr:MULTISPECIES: DUF975 family protein [Clostridium]MBS5305029.1 DUF975 family protein [Clostridium sp.]MDB1932303.1 DUF975 family protein [Clostridium tertium]MDB1936455.1 DUF975 family protein [Clostridium tertium]MDB1942965.1 DUF975 family protein [Clostridium tertium]MDB1950066.1 DUF975 family protein [Clostridium tertium]